MTHSTLATATPDADAPLDVLTLDDAERVAGGMPWLIIGIAIGCALLLKHD